MLLQVRLGLHIQHTCCFHWQQQRCCKPHKPCEPCQHGQHQPDCQQHWQAMTTQPELPKALHIPCNHRRPRTPPMQAVTIVHMCMRHHISGHEYKLPQGLYTASMQGFHETARHKVATSATCSVSKLTVGKLATNDLVMLHARHLHCCL